MSSKKVILGLSGGVDSAVAAYLLKQQGYEVIPVFMRNWDSALNNDISGNPNSFEDICPQEKDYLDAVKVSETLGLELLRVDFVKEYWDKVFLYFLNEYKLSRTPNPDVFCNNEIKFKAFLEYAETLNYDYIAMGHYAKIIKIDNCNQLAKASDLNKDQSYFLCMLSLKQIQKVIFPLEEITKPEVRKIASIFGDQIATKKDSTGICFIGERDFPLFLSNYLKSDPGDIKRITGEILGTHTGLINYTIGQRKSIGIGGTKITTDPWYIVAKDPKTNTLYAEPSHNNIYLLSNVIYLTDLSLRYFDNKKKVYAKFRYRAADEEVILNIQENNCARLDVVNYSWGVTPGQICALYQGDICIGGGIIDKVFYNNEPRGLV